MKWHKVYLRKMTEEEKEFYVGDSDEIWDGDIPEIGERVLVTYPLKRGGYPPTDIDIWMEIDNGVGFEYAYNDVIYWMELPEYNGELDD